MDEESLFPDTDLDLSFTSVTTDRTFTTTTTTSTSSARSSLARSSLTLSFNESHLSSAAAPISSTSLHHHHHRKSDPHWSSIKAATNLSSDGKLHLPHFKLVRHLGTGNLGRVFLCHLRDCNTAATFALKVVDKDSLTAKKLSHVQMEADILSMRDHPYLPTLFAHFEVSHYTCFLIDYCPNGDLHSLLRKQPNNRFSLQAVRFFAAEVLVVLEYLHALGIIYRDLKPENILLREDGHIMLSDFDLCFKSDVVPTLQTRVQNVDYARRKRWRKLRNCFKRRQTATEEEEERVMEFIAEPVTAFSRSCVGTHEYLAPELVSGNGHGNGVDWWAFGILIYELMYGSTPFRGRSKEDTLRNIASRSRQVVCHVRDNREEEEEGAAADARDLIEKLLVKDPRERLGCAKGAAEIKQHPFFEGIKWALIRNYKPPEVRGLVRRTRSHVTGIISSNKKRRCWWKNLGLLGFTKRNYHNLSLNSSNYYQYCYVNNKSMKCA